MDTKDNIYQVDFDKIKSVYSDASIIDDSIAFHNDIRDLPIKDGLIQINMYIIVACLNGKMQVEVNTKPYTIHQCEVLICRSNDMVNNCMISPDFAGCALCLSQKGVLEQISEGSLWEKAFSLAEFPVISISDESMKLLKLYGESIQLKLKSTNSFYYKEIIVSIVKAIIYELLSNVDDSKSASCGENLLRQREVLFKNFIGLLSESRVKSRNVSWYADRLCVTPKYLSTLCKQVSGKTAFSWINEYVKVDIRNYLKNTNKTIKEVADTLGFPNLSFFGKYCRAHFGMSPTEYRKQLRREFNNMPDQSA